LIWLVLVAAVFVGGGAWFVAKSMRTRAVVLVAGLVAVGTYWFLGKPDMGDEPLDTRIEGIETLARDNPESMRLDQVIALAQKRALDDPKDPRPHWIMGQVLESANNPGAALLAYESALRRDPNDVQTLTNLADLRFKMSGQVDPATTQLYQQSFAAQPDNLRVGYLAGIGLWLQGQKAEAEALWAGINSRAPENGPERQMFAALRQMFGIDPAPAEPAVPAVNPPNK
jgi:cytochrome c-type biogenesis protein CcmH/NrfG